MFSVGTTSSNEHFSNNSNKSSTNKSLPASPDSQKPKPTKLSKSVASSQTNSLYGSIDCNMNGEQVGSSCSAATTTIDTEKEFDGLIYRDTNNASNTMHKLNVLRKNREFCDLILQLDDDSQDIYCHQLILACNSKFFMEIFNDYELDTGAEVKESPALNKTPIIKKQSLQEYANKNHSSNHRQLLFCLSDYLRNFLSGGHHHYVKINSIINHNNHQYHTNGIDSTKSQTHDEETINHINQNLDYQALKICIDYMYTSELRVPSHLLPHVYTLAYHLSIESIVQVCGQYLSRLLNVDNCLSIRSFALDENLIEASSECIEKNIEYILQLRPLSLTSRGSVSSSMNSLVSNSSSKFNGQTDNIDLTDTSSTLSSTLNLANKEFNHLPRIKIELVGLKTHKYKLPENIEALATLCMNWLVEELMPKSGEHSDLNHLCEHLNMLYINNDSTLHDCCDMDAGDSNFDDYIDDYQKLHHVLNTNVLTVNGNGKQKRSKAAPSISPSPSPTPSCNSRLKTFTITDKELNAIGTATPIKLKVLHDNEIICNHQTSENSFITICTLSGNLVTLSVHLLCKKQQNDANHNGETNCEVFMRNRIASNKSDTCEFNAESQFSIDQQYNTGGCSHVVPKFNRSVSTNSGALDSEKIPKMCVARCSHGVIAYNEKLYIIGGYDRGECLNICEVYEPSTNTLHVIEPMANRRGRAAITWFNKDNSIYVMGGSDGYRDLNSVESYNVLENKWTCRTFDYELACSNLGTTACQNYIYLVGLKGDSRATLSRTSCLKYEPKANAFTRLAELNHGRSQGALVCALSNEDGQKHLLFVFGGHDQIRCLNTCEVYNPDEDKWTLIASMHEPRRGCGAAAHRETQTVFIVGGTNGTQSLKTVEIYNILTQRWTHGPELNIARTNVAIAFIGNNLFAVGGFDGKSFLRTIEYLNINNMDAGWSLFHKPTDF